MNDTLYTLNKGRFEVGKIGENDLLKSELALLRARASVDDAKLARDRAEAALRRMLNYPADQSLAIVTPDSIPTVEADPDVAVKEALKNASLIEQSSLDEVNVHHEITQAKLNNGFNAQVAATVGFNQTAGAFGAAYQSPHGAAIAHPRRHAADGPVGRRSLRRRGRQGGRPAGRRRTTRRAAIRSPRTRASPCSSWSKLNAT